MSGTLAHTVRTICPELGCTAELAILCASYPSDGVFPARLGKVVDAELPRANPLTGPIATAPGLAAVQRLCDTEAVQALHWSYPIRLTGWNPLLKLRLPDPGARSSNG